MERWPGDDYSGLDWLDMSIPYGHGNLPVVVFTHEGRLKDGRRVLERIVASGKAERVRLYQCGDPGLFAREKEDLIRSVADELDEFDEKSTLLMAAAWSGVCQAATIGRIAENEYERRQVVGPFRDTWIDGVELDTFVDILRGLPFNSLLEVETFAAALWNPVCMCKALAAAWAKSLHSTLRGASPAALVSGATPVVDPATGHPAEVALYSVIAGRDAWSKLNFDAIHSIEPAETLALFDLRRAMSKTGIMKPVKAFTLEQLELAAG